MTNDKSSKTEVGITNNITKEEHPDVASEDTKDLVSKIMRYESGLMSEDDTINFFQQLINTGHAWTLQGHYGRMAKHFINIGVCDAK